MDSKKHSIKFALLALAIIAHHVSLGQSLPSVQEKSLRTPAGVKIDGRATELNNIFEAYNKSTNIYYTLSNDDNNFYLVIQSINIGINNKIMNRGITFTVNPYGRKNEKEGMSITFPVITESYRTALRRPIPGLNYGKNEDSMPKNAKTTKTSKETLNNQQDSMINLRHRAFLTYAKEIGVSGIKQISEQVISIYNDRDITAKISIDKKNVLTYELSVPLRYFGLTTDAPRVIVYDIALNDSSMLYKGSAPPRLRIQGDPRGLGGIDIRSLDNRTDFWGSYKLAK